MTLVKIYFKNGNTAVVPSDKVIFDKGTGEVDYLKEMKRGMSVVKEDAIAWARQMVNDPEEDDRR